MLAKKALFTAGQLVSILFSVDSFVGVRLMSNAFFPILFVHVWSGLLRCVRFGSGKGGGWLSVDCNPAVTRNLTRDTSAKARRLGWFVSLHPRIFLTGHCGTPTGRGRARLFGGLLRLEVCMYVCIVITYGQYGSTG